MARGLVAGVVCGAVVAVAGAAAVSLYVGMSDRPLSETPEAAIGEPVEEVSSAEASSAVSLPETLSAGSPSFSGGSVPQDPDVVPEIAPVPQHVPRAEEPPQDTVMPSENTLPDTPPLRYEEAADSPVVAERRAAPALRPREEAAVSMPGTSPLDTPERAGAEPPAPADTTPANVPRVAQDSMTLGQPDSPDSTGDVSVASEAPVMPALQGMEPAAPEPEREPTVTTQPVQPPLPMVPLESSGLVAADGDSLEAPRLPVIDAGPAAELQVDASETTGERSTRDTLTDTPVPEATADNPTTEATADNPTTADTRTTKATANPTAEHTADRPTTEATDNVSAPEDMAGTPTAEVTGEAPDPEAATEAPTLDFDAEEPVPEDAEAAPEPRPSIGTPARTLLGRDDTRDAPADAAPDEATGTAAEEREAPLKRFAVPVEVAPDVPLLSVVLIDDPEGLLGSETLENFPFPLTIAIDPSDRGARARMQEYRAQGFEVVVIGAVPEGAQASDIEVALAAALSAVPEAVAVIEPPRGGLQSARQVSDQVAQVVRESGHGLVLMANGLNTAHASAVREGVPTATVFRDFDGVGQDADTIRRVLDSAAFRARQNGNVIMLGRLRTDTISALRLWGGQQRASQLALVPVSMLLRAGEEAAD